VVKYRNVLFIASTAIPALALAAIVYTSIGDKGSIADRLVPAVGPSVVSTAETGQVVVEDSSTDQAEDADLPDADRKASAFFASVPSDEEIDPAIGKGFLISVMLKIDQLPNTDARQKIVSKYNDNQPLIGWAVALRRYNDIVRPEVYYRGKDGKGGWYPFEAVQIDPNLWYNLSLIVNPEHWMVLFWEPARPGAENVLGDWPGGDRDAVIDAVSSDRGVKTVIFLGGHDLGDIVPPATNADLQFGAKRAKGIFGGEVAAVLVARLEGLPAARGELRELVTGGAPGIERRLNPQAIGLLVNRQGKDRSRFARTINILGG
jgi:hypothetical protein